MIEIAEREQRWDEAVSLLKDSVRQDPIPELYLRLGRAFQHLGNWINAEEAYQKTLGLDPTLNEAPECLGSLYLERDDLDRSAALNQAVDWFEIAWENRPTARIANYLGVVFENQDRTDEAKAYFRKAIELDPEFEEAYLNLSQLVQDGEPQIAMQLLQRAIEIDPEYALAHQKLGILQQESTENEEAEYHFARAIELDGSDVWSHLYLANLLAVQGETARAQREFETAVALDINDLGAKEFLARFRAAISDQS